MGASVWGGNRAFIRKLSAVPAYGRNEQGTDAGSSEIEHYLALTTPKLQ